MTLFVMFSAMAYYFTEHFAPAPLFSDTGNYENTEHYALHSKVYESDFAVYIAGLKLFLLAFLPAFVLSRWFLNFIYYFKGRAVS